MKRNNDRFTSISRLRAEMREGADYRIIVADRKSHVTVVSPHGGFIEAGTSCIARGIAGDDFNLFDFQGLREERPWELHVTSTRFRHPQLRALLRQSWTAVSVHGMGEVDHWRVWMGGLNLIAREKVGRALCRAGFQVLSHPPIYKGESTRNFVNLVPESGVQLELPRDLIESMFDGSPFELDREPLANEQFHRFTGAVRSVLADRGGGKKCSLHTRDRARAPKASSRRRG